MNDVIVVTHCTHRSGIMDVYERQLANAGIEFYIETIPRRVVSMADRIAYLRDMATKFRDYKTIIVTDAWDVLFFGTKQEVLDKPQTVLISAERNCFPGLEYGYADLTDVIKGDTPWRYSNPGMIAANPILLLEWLEKAEKTEHLDWVDQAWCNHYLANESGLVVLDTTTSLLCVVSSHKEEGAIQVKDDRLWNSKCDTYPNFFHFAGHGHIWVQRVLPGRNAPGMNTPGFVMPRDQTLQLIRGYMESRGI